MLKAVIFALASSESNETPILVVLILPIKNDTPWNSTVIRGHFNISILILIPTGHVRVVSAHRQSDDMTAILLSAKWPVELVLISNATSCEKNIDKSRIYRILALAI
jgi:hypothetical protein